MLGCREDKAGVNLAKALFSCHLFTLAPTNISRDQCVSSGATINTNSISVVTDQSQASGCLVTSGCCRLSAADEEWYFSSSPSSTVAVHQRVNCMQKYCILLGLRRLSILVEYFAIVLPSQNEPLLAPTLDNTIEVYLDRLRE